MFKSALTVLKSGTLFSRLQCSCGVKSSCCTFIVQTLEPVMQLVVWHILKL